LMVSVHGLAANRQKARNQPSPDRTLAAIAPPSELIDARACLRPAAGPSGAGRDSPPPRRTSPALRAAGRGVGVGNRSPSMTRRIAAVTAASSSAGRSIIGTAPDIKSTEEMCEVPGTRSFNAVRENAHTLSDFRVPTLSIECEPCGRRGRYNVARLMEKYGDAKLPPDRTASRRSIKTPQRTGPK
jgi:hypothetical protein